MEVFIAPRAGIWCRSVSGWDAFRSALAAGQEPELRAAGPVPDLLPPREGRRAPLHVRLGIEAGVQACRENGLAVADVMTVFASAMGDVEITDYLCRALAGSTPMLSPTRFHNSVHNAASGYWSIGAANRLPSVAVAAEAFTFPAALLEAATLAVCESGTVALIAYDVPAPVAMHTVCRNRQPFAAGVLVSSRQVTPDWRPVHFDHQAEGVRWPETGAAWLRQLSEENDCARSLPLLAALAGNGPISITLPLSPAASLRIESAR